MRRARGQDFRGARLTGKIDGGVTATLKQGHSACAAETAILLRDCITLLQTLHYPVGGETRHAMFVRFAHKPL